MEALFEDRLIIFGVGEFEQYTGGCFGQTEATFEIHFLADQGGPLHR